MFPLHSVLNAALHHRSIVHLARTLQRVRAHVADWGVSPRNRYRPLRGTGTRGLQWGLNGSTGTRATEAHKGVTRMNVKDTLRAINALPHMVATYRDGEYRITLTFAATRAYYPGDSLERIQQAREEMAYYTNDADDALATAQYMERNQ